VVLTVPEMLIVKIVKQSVAVAVAHEEVDEEVEELDGSVLDGSSFCGSRSLTGGVGL
jgi:hypothetical protein